MRVMKLIYLAGVCPDEQVSADSCLNWHVSLDNRPINLFTNKDKLTRV